MFDFEKLDVYNEVKQLNTTVLRVVLTDVKDLYIKEQWKRATLNIMLSLAEGTSRMLNSEKKHFYTLSRSSVFECVAIMDVLHGCGDISKETYDEFYAKYEKLSKMLLGMYRNVV